MTNSGELFVARNALAANYVRHPKRPSEMAVAVLVQNKEGTDELWAMEETMVLDLVALLAGPLSEDSVRILNELSQTQVVTSWSQEEDEETGRDIVHLVLYGQVSCEIPVHDANSAIQMLGSVLHAQGHKELGD